MAQPAGLAVLLTCLPGMAGAAEPPPVSFTQRDINVMAAGIEEARSALLDDAGLRHTGEDLNHYLRRIAQPLPGETALRYQARITHYLDLLGRSVRVTRKGRRLPLLHDTDSGNRALWERTVRGLQQFPARVAHTQAAWRPVQQLSARNALSNGKTARFASELAQTVSFLIALDDGLRDARP